eukprot:3903904-Prymnesium_polylepis.1
MYEASMYVAGAEASAVSAQQFTGIPVRPGEDARAKEDDDWWRQFNNVLSSSTAQVHIAECAALSRAWRTGQRWEIRERGVVALL